MSYTGLFKRIIPFVLTFAAGLLLASFFVSITPNFNNWRTERRAHRCHDKRQLRMENHELRQRLRTTENELREVRRTIPDQEMDFVIPDAVPPVELEAPHPPPPPRKPKHPRVDTLR